MRGVLFLGLIACWTVVCNCEDGWMDSGALASTVDLDEHLWDLSKKTSIFREDTECECGENGSCKRDENKEKICTCDDGYSEIGTGDEKTCKECNCGDKGQCKFNDNGEKTCACDDAYLEIGTGDEKTCKECNCGDKGQCKFNENGEKTCTCSTGYLEIGTGDEKTCKAECKKDEDCRNGAKCGEKKICECIEGTSGDDCGLIDGCNDLKCVAKIAVCKFDEEKKAPFCECTAKNQIYVDGKCIGICESDEGCSDGEKCKALQDDGPKICRCLKGRSGDKCSVIDDCVTGKFKNCKGDRGKCDYDEEQETAICECDNENKVDPAVGICKKTCQEKTDCNHEADCLKVKDTEYGFCSCKKEFEGDLCEIVKECKATKFKDCKGENGTCVYSEKEKKAVCECGDKKEIDKAVNYCKDCYCGENGKCEFKKSVKTCNCDKNYAEKADGLCYECNCGEKGNCKFVNDSKTCECPKNYLVYEGICKECNCGEGNCSFVEGKKHCDCRETFVYKEKTEKCEKCYCGNGQDECSFEEDEIKCHCKDEYKVFKDKCVECNCGVNGDCDLNKEGKKECSCHAGYAKTTRNRTETCVETCEKDDNCENSGKCKEARKDVKFCDCKTGTTGDRCEVITECETGSYKNCKSSGGECKLEGTTAKCTCTDPKKLDTNLKMCRKKCDKKEDCQNDAKCENNLCKCPPGISGDDCDTINNCDELNCQSINADCIYDKINSKGTCQCKDENRLYVNKKCVEKCKKNDDCKHGATCANELCQCLQGTSGDKCENIDDCPKLECENITADCIFDTKEKAATCKCKDEKFIYKNKKCVAKWCEANCNDDKNTRCGYTNGTGVCLCNDKGKYFDYTSNTCEVIDKCLLDVKCEENQVCEDGKCVCKNPYEEKDKKCQRKKLCGTTSNPCFSGANCTEGKEPGLIVCQCLSEEGYYSEAGKCEDGSCFLPNKREKCKGACPKDMKRGDKGQCVANSDDKKCSKDCGPLGWCYKKDKDTEECRCDPVYALGKDGKCVLNAEKVCATKMLLKDDPYKCNCDGTFKYAKNGVTCEKKACSEEDAQKDCKSKGASCIDKWTTKGVGYECVCPTGYVMENGKCLDPCSRPAVKTTCSVNGQVCYTGEDSNGDCKCYPTFLFNKDKKTCEASGTNSTFMLHGLPVVSKSYVKNQVVDIVALSKDVKNSMKKAFKNLDFAVVFNYKHDGDVILCEVWLQFQTPVPKDLDPPAEVKRMKTWIINKVSSIDAIILPPALLLNNKKFKSVNDEPLTLCSDSVKRAVCGLGSKCSENKCTCENGYRIIDSTIQVLEKTTVLRCEDIDECAENVHNCPENSTCVNTPGDYFCRCTKGNKKKEGDDPNALDKKPCTGLCNPNPCGAGSCKVTDKFTVDCTCPRGRTGSFCDRSDDNLKKAGKNTTVVGAVLGTLLAITIILIVVYILRQRKNSYSEEFTPAPRMDNAEMIERRPMRGVSNRGYQ